MKKDLLGTRMKEYEKSNNLKLLRKIPVIIRIDGKAFHTFTKKSNKPFDETLMKVMQKTSQYLCENIQGCKLAYTQSDDISLLLTDWENINTECWFQYSKSKIESVSASMATLAFNKFWYEEVENLKNILKNNIKNNINNNAFEILPILKRLESKNFKAMFDSRAFNLPKEEVCNYFIWRQQDATRNSIQMVGQSMFTYKQLQGKSCNMIQDMLFKEKGINWNDLSIPKKRGSCIIKKSVICEGKEGTKAIRRRWIIDNEIPIFTEDNYYINKVL